MRTGQTSLGSFHWMGKPIGHSLEGDVDPQQRRATLIPSRGKLVQVRTIGRNRNRLTD